MVDIFESAKEKAMPGWAKFVNAGDSVQGTYVGKIVGQKDGYGNEQVIYQLLEEDGKLTNVGFGLNKKFLIQDMEQVKFGQIIGFKYKGKLQIKDKFGKIIEVKDFGLHQDPKIVNEVWLKDNKDSMPETIHVVETEAQAANAAAEKEYEAAGEQADVPFSTPGSLTNDDKLKAIEKLATDKLGSTTSVTAKPLVMEKTGIAFIPVNYDKILETLTIL